MANSMLKFAITGDKDIIRNLYILSEKALTAVGKAVKKAADPVVKDARSRVPVRYGHLKKMIGVRIRKYKRNRIAVAIIGAKTDRFIGPQGEPIRPSNYIHLVEWGSTNTPAWPLPYKRIGGRVVRQLWMHPGVKAHPFLTPAFEAHKEGALEIARQVIEEETMKALKNE